MIILTPNKIDFETSNFTVDKEEYIIMMKASIHYKCMPNHKALMYTKQKLVDLKGKIRKLIIARDFNSFLLIDGTRSQKWAVRK